MSHNVQCELLKITTNAAGAKTDYFEEFAGRILQIRYVKDDFADGVDFVFSLETTGVAILTGANVNASQTFVPRQPTHAVSDGAVLVYTGDNDEQCDFIYVAENERVKLAVTAGGNTKSGSFYLWHD